MKLVSLSFLLSFLLVLASVNFAAGVPGSLINLGVSYGIGAAPVLQFSSTVIQYVLPPDTVDRGVIAVSPTFDSIAMQYGGIVTCSLNGVSIGTYTEVSAAIGSNTLACFTNLDASANITYYATFTRPNPGYHITGVSIEADGQFIPLVDISGMTNWNPDVRNWTTSLNVPVNISFVDLAVSASSNMSISYFLPGSMTAFAVLPTSLNGTVSQRINLIDHSDTNIIVRDGNFTYSLKVIRTPADISSLWIRDNSTNQYLPWPVDATTGSDATSAGQTSGSFNGKKFSYSLNIASMRVAIVNMYFSGIADWYMAGVTSYAACVSGGDFVLPLNGTGPFVLYVHSESAAFGNVTYTINLVRGLGYQLANVVFTEVNSTIPLNSPWSATTKFPTYVGGISPASAINVRVDYAVTGPSVFGFLYDASMNTILKSYGVISPNTATTLSLPSWGPFVFVLNTTDPSGLAGNYSFPLYRAATINSVTLVDGTTVLPFTINRPFIEGVYNYTFDLASSQSIRASVSLPAANFTTISANGASPLTLLNNVLSSVIPSPTGDRGASWVFQIVAGSGTYRFEGRRDVPSFSLLQTYPTADFNFSLTQRMYNTSLPAGATSYHFNAVYSAYDNATFGLFNNNTIVSGTTNPVTRGGPTPVDIPLSLNGPLRLTVYSLFAGNFYINIFRPAANVTTATNSSSNATSSSGGTTTPPATLTAVVIKATGGSAAFVLNPAFAQTVTSYSSPALGAAQSIDVQLTFSNTNGVAIGTLNGGNPFQLSSNLVTISLPSTSANPSVLAVNVSGLVYSFSLSRAPDDVTNVVMNPLQSPIVWSSTVHNYANAAVVGTNVVSIVPTFTTANSVKVSLVMNGAVVNGTETLAVSGVSLSFTVPVNSSTILLRLNSLVSGVYYFSVSIPADGPYNPVINLAVARLNTTTSVLDPAFDPTVREYRAIIDVASPSFAISAIFNGTNEQLTVSFDGAANYSYSLVSGQVLNLPLPVNTTSPWLVRVISSINGLYVIRVFRQLGLTKVNVMDVTGASLTFSPAFLQVVFNYQFTLPYASQSILIAPSADTDYTVLAVVQSATSTPIPAISGKAVTIPATATSGSFQITVSPTNFNVVFRTYTFNWVRAAAPASADVSAIYLINPATGTNFYVGFVPSVYSYSVTLPAAATYFQYQVNFNSVNGGALIAGTNSNSTVTVISGAIAVQQLPTDFPATGLLFTVQSNIIGSTPYQFTLVRETPDFSGIVFTECTSSLSKALAVTPAFSPSVRSYSVAIQSTTTCLSYTATFRTAGSISSTYTGTVQSSVTGVATSVQLSTTASLSDVLYIDSTVNGRFTFTITRPAPQGITSISINDAATSTALTLVPAFSQSVRNYTVSISAALVSISLNVVYLSPDQVTALVPTMTAPLALTSNTAVSAQLGSYPGSLFITSLNVGQFVITFNRQNVTGGSNTVYDTTSLLVNANVNGTIMTLPLSPAFSKDVRIYSVSVPYFVGYVFLTAAYSTATASVSYYSSSFTTNIAMVSSVQSQSIAVSVGSTTITYLNSVDSLGAFTIIVQRATPPKYLRDGCAARASAIAAACPNTDITNDVYSTACTSTCALGTSQVGSSFISFFEDCVGFATATAGTTTSAWQVAARIEYAACQPYRPISFYYPPGAGCDVLETAAKTAGCVAPTDSTVSAQCAATCAPAWKQYAYTCLLGMPTSNTAYASLKALSTACDITSPTSLSGVSPSLSYSQLTGGQTGLVFLYWNNQTFVAQNLRVDSWTVESCLDATCSSPSVVPGCDKTVNYYCSSNGWTSFQQLWFRLRAWNAAGASAYSPIILATAQGKPIPAPTPSCTSTFTSIAVSFVPYSASASNSPYPVASGYRSFLFADASEINSYQIANDQSATYGGVGGIPVPGVLNVKETLAIQSSYVGLNTTVITFNKLTPNTTYILYIQVTSSPFNGLVSMGFRCTTAMPIGGGGVSTPPLTVAPTLVGSTVQVSPSAIDASTLASQIFFRAVAVGTSAPIKGGKAIFTYKPFVSSLTSAYVNWTVAVQAPDTILTSGAVQSNLYGSLSFPVNFPPFDKAGTLTLTGVEVTDLNGNVLSLLTRDQLLANGVVAANSIVSNSFIQYPAGQQCSSRQTDINTACQLRVQSGYFGSKCLSASCASLFNSFYNDCLIAATYPPSTSTTNIADLAKAYFTDCQQYKKLSDYYPSGTTCSTDEANVVRVCGLTDISTYVTGVTCSAACSSTFIKFADTCFINVPTTSPYIQSEAAFYGSCKASVVVTPTIAPKLTAVGGQGGTSINARFGYVDASVTGSLNFILNISSNAGASWSVAYQGPNNAFTILNLSPSTKYTLNVVAYNFAGLSPVSANVDVTTRSVAPAAPTSFAVNANSITSNSFSASWVAPVTSDPAVASFAPCIGVNGDCAIVAKVSATTLTYTFTNLQPSTVYTVSVVSISALGDISAKATPASAITMAATPAAPPAPVARETLSTSVTIGIVNSFDATNSVSSYEVTLAGPAGTTAVVNTVPRNSNATATGVSYVLSVTQFTGLTANTVYTVTAVAVSSSTGLRSAASTATTVTTRGTLPSPPSQPTISVASASGFTVTWSIPASDGGSTITGYVVSALSSADNYLTPYTVQVLGQSFTFDKVKPGSTYLVSVRAANAYGLSESAQAPKVTLPYVAPTIVSIAAANGGSLTADFAVTSRIVIAFSSPINVAALASSDDTTYFTFSPDVTCPFTFANSSALTSTTIPGTLFELSFTSATGCSAPVIGSTTIALKASANFVSGSGVVVSAASTSTSPVLGGRWGTAVKFVAAVANVVSVPQGSNTVPLSRFFTLNSAFSALTTSVSIRITSTLGTVAPVTLATYDGAANAFGSDRLSYSVPDFTAGQTDTIKLEIRQSGALVDSAVVVATIAPTNHPIVISAPGNFSIAPSAASSPVKKVIGQLGIADPDTQLFPKAAATITFQVVGPGLLYLQSIPADFTDVVSKPAVNTATSSLTLQGTVTSIDSILKAGVLYASFDANLSGDRSAIIINVNDNNNGLGGDSTIATNITTTYARAVILVDANCALSAAPALVSAQVYNAQNGFDLSFDSSFLLPASGTSTVFNCLNVLDDATVAKLGSGASCTPKGDHALSFFFGQGNSVNSALTLTLRSQTVSRCAASSTFSSGSIALTLSQFPMTPSVSLTGLDVYSPCVSAVISAQTTVDVSQSPSFAWSVSASDGSSIDVSAVSGSSLELQPSVLTPGLSYKVSASFTNAFGVASTPGSFSFRVAAFAVAGVRVRGDRVLRLLRGTVSNVYPILVDVTLPPCMAPNDKSLNFAWDVTPAVSNFGNSDGSKLQLQLSNLLDGVEYTFSLSVYSRSATNVTAASQVLTDVKITMVSADISVLPELTPIRQVATTDSISNTITAFDPSFVDGNFTYAWTCSNSAGEACVSATDATVVIGPNAPAWTVAAGTLVPDTYSFSVVASKGTRSSPTVIFAVTVIASLPPIVNIACPTSAVPTDAAVAISASVTRRNSGSTLSYAWSAYAAMFGSIPTLSTTGAQFVFNSDRVDNFWILGSTYTIALTVTETFGTAAVPITVKCTLPILSTPSGGSFTVTPASGNAYDTVFTFVASGFQPASVAFKYTLLRYNTDGTSAVISPLSDEGSFSVTLPTPTTADLTHIIGVRVVNPAGASLVRTVNVTITAPAAPATFADLTSTLNNLLTDTVNRGDVDGSMNAISSIASNANAKVTGVANALLQVKPDSNAATTLNEVLVNSVGQIKKSVTPAQTLSTLNAISSAPDTLSTTAATSITSMLSDVFTDVKTNHASDAAQNVKVAPQASSTGLAKHDVQSAANTLGNIIKSSTTVNTNATTSPNTRRRMLASGSSTTTTSTNDRETVLAGLSTMRDLLSMESQTDLTVAGSQWHSQSTTSGSYAGVTRFSTDSSLTMKLPGTVADSVVITSSLTDSTTITTVDGRFITTTPNPFTWATLPSGASIVTGSSAVTIEITDTLGNLLVDDSVSLQNLAFYSYTLQQAYSLTACPVATCQPVCMVYDPVAAAWASVDVVTLVDTANGVVTCSTATPGTVGLITSTPTSQLVQDVLPPQALTASNSSSQNMALLIGVTIGVALCLLLVVGVGVCFIYRKNANNKLDPMADGVQLHSIRSTAWTSESGYGKSPKLPPQHNTMPSIII